MEEDEQDKAKFRFRTYPDHPVFILIILFCLYLSLGEDENMMTGWKKMDRMKASLRYRTYLVYLVLILIIMFCIPYIKDVYDLAYR